MQPVGEGITLVALGDLVRGLPVAAPGQGHRLEDAGPYVVGRGHPVPTRGPKRSRP
jgi:hypothetical protein